MATFDQFRKRLAENLQLEQEKRQKQLRGELKPKVKTKVIVKKVRVRPKRKPMSPARRRQALLNLGKAFDPRMKFAKRKPLKPLGYKPNSNLSKEQLLREFERQKFSELERYKQLQQTQSPSFRRLVDRLSFVQTASRRADQRRARLLREREGLGKMQNLMKAHENLNKVELDMTGVDPETNILFAKNVFKEEASNSIFRKREGARTILDLQEDFKLKF